MRTSVVAIPGLVGLALGLAACVSLKRTPEARFFVLRSLPEAQAAPASPSPDPAGFVGVLPVRLPGHLDRPQLVMWTTRNELRIDEFLRWAEPLDAGATRTLAEDLAILLPESRVVRSPWPASATPRCRVFAELRVFGPQSGGEVRLEGRFAVLAPKDERTLVARPLSLGRGPLGMGPDGPDPRAEVDAMSELLADLAKEIAEAVRSLPADTSLVGR